MSNSSRDTIRQVPYKADLNYITNKLYHNCKVIKASLTINMNIWVYK